MRTAEEIRDLVEQSMKRDFEDLDLDGKIAEATKNTPVHPELVALLTRLLRESAPLIFEGAYFAGATAGMQIASDLRKP